MNEDVFNLKIGNEIYQVDYDHHTGKFTDKQLINPTNNLIVCGLHSLYGDNDSVYNLKIYMDTDDNLKKKWKINRDVKERGYSIEKVLENIKKREKDFNDFILPQKENADVIVKFFTTDKIDFNNLEQKIKLSLSLSISKNFNINKILLTFKRLKIPFIVTNRDKFNTITFLDYVEIDLGYGTKSFYDYILHFILTL
jgi:uridine kinase